MKKLIILIVTLLSSLMLNAQNAYVDFWGHYDYNKKKVKNDSKLVLSRGRDQKSYRVYKKGKLIDILYHRHVEYQRLYNKVRIQEKNGEFYLGNYQIIMSDSTLAEEIKSLYGSRLNHGSHYSHYSSSFNHETN